MFTDDQEVWNITAMVLSVILILVGSYGLSSTQKSSVEANGEFGGDLGDEDVNQIDAPTQYQPSGPTYNTME